MRNFTSSTIKGAYFGKNLADEWTKADSMINASTFITSVFLHPVDPTLGIIPFQ